eukprot:c17970_g1_i2.p1 GENE.c17970_g1_i2~~c17970_g1_i2.p1  ORF type:complete len:1257 (+),score=268.00 c17970_g1_i2:473-3772(+)
MLDVLSRNGTVKVALSIDQADTANLAQKSTNEQWISRGKTLFEAKLFSDAKMCFLHAGDQRKATQCEAAENVHRARSCESRIQARQLYEKGAELYLELQMFDKAATNFETAEAFEKAADAFRKADRRLDAARMFESAGRWEDAISEYAELGMFDKAADICYAKRRYDRLIELEQKFRNENRDYENVAKLAQELFKKIARRVGKTNKELTLKFAKLVKDESWYQKFLEKNEFYDELAELAFKKNPMNSMRYLVLNGQLDVASVRCFQINELRRYGIRLGLQFLRLLLPWWHKDWGLQLPTINQSRQDLVMQSFNNHLADLPAEDSLDLELYRIRFDACHRGSLEVLASAEALVDKSANGHHRISFMARCLILEVWLCGKASLGALVILKHLNEILNFVTFSSELLDEYFRNWDKYRELSDVWNLLEVASIAHSLPDHVLVERSAWWARHRNNLEPRGHHLEGRKALFANDAQRVLAYVSLRIGDLTLQKLTVPDWVKSSVELCKGVPQDTSGVLPRLWNVDATQRHVQGLVEVVHVCTAMQRIHDKKWAGQGPSNMFFDAAKETAMWQLKALLVGTRLFLPAAPQPLLADELAMQAICANTYSHCLSQLPSKCYPVFILPHLHTQIVSRLCGQPPYTPTHDAYCRSCGAGILDPNCECRGSVIPKLNLSIALSFQYEAMSIRQDNPVRALDDLHDACLESCQAAYSSIWKRSFEPVFIAAIYLLERAVALGVLLRLGANKAVILPSMYVRSLGAIPEKAYDGIVLANSGKAHAVHNELYALIKQAMHQIQTKPDGLEKTSCVEIDSFHVSQDEKQSLKLRLVIAIMTGALNLKELRELLCSERMAFGLFDLLGRQRPELRELRPLTIRKELRTLLLKLGQDTVMLHLKSETGLDEPALCVNPASVFSLGEYALKPREIKYKPGVFTWLKNHIFSPQAASNAEPAAQEQLTERIKSQTLTWLARAREKLRDPLEVSKRQFRGLKCSPQYIEAATLIIPRVHQLRDEAKTLAEAIANLQRRMQANSEEIAEDWLELIEQAENLLDQVKTLEQTLGWTNQTHTKSDLEWLAARNSDLEKAIQETITTRRELGRLAKKEAKPKA